MGKQLTKLTSRLRDFIERQHLFFVATAMEDGRINLSPKGLNTLRVVDDQTVLWLNLTGSGNETAAHLHYAPRMTLMFCAFEGRPLILRLYGRAKAYHPRDAFWKREIGNFPDLPGKRQIIELKIEMVQTSCGMGVPLMEYSGQRQELVTWAETMGEEGLQAYWEEKNSRSLDGLPTGIFD